MLSQAAGEDLSPVCPQVDPIYKTNCSGSFALQRVINFAGIRIGGDGKKMYRKIPTKLCLLSAVIV